ncbi:hypothetical protein D3C86_1660710 [compost metagenome]
MVEITRRTRCHNNIVSHFGRFNSARFTLPTHNGGFRSQTALQNFIPTNHFSILGNQEFFNSANEITLQFLFVFQLLRFHSGLTFGAFFPTCLIYLIASNMNICRRENCHHLGKYIFQKSKSLIIARTVITFTFTGKEIS